MSGGYDLGDMAADVVALLDHLRVDRAHLVGMSMGGMIAQIVAATHPERVATLTSIFSTTGASGVGGIARSAMLRLAVPAPSTQEEAVERHVRTMRHIGSRSSPSTNRSNAPGPPRSGTAPVAAPGTPGPHGRSTRSGARVTAPSRSAGSPLPPS
ncbi:alpha/beta fold hydrolase [Mobilicoccus caccae]|uniref:AB hydrolase-1 domain-containing protein n=1 Tax=Mobilicoccus caccae TaxID=1859295 RepID=A0ABQ6INC7_9MICO|nr:alpha/beta fold hydrolase [Mobilicoccus caccae]GMA38835.1 hypothetical protein GCM10025883_08800 [Mobilicoccus caccae]